MESLKAYRRAIIFNATISLLIAWIVNRYASPLDKGLIKDIGLSLVSFFGTLIGFLITIVSILASNNSEIIKQLKKTGHYRRLISITLFTGTAMLLFCIYAIGILVFNTYVDLFYQSILLALFLFPIGMMIRLFFIYYLLLV